MTAFSKSQSITNGDVTNGEILDCVHELFNHHVKSNPNKICLIYDNRSLTYIQVAQSVNKLANILVNTLNVNVGDIICQCFERSFEMIISLLAIISVGGVYCPLNPNDPSKRLNTLFNETKSRFILVHTLTKEKFENDEPLINIDQYINFDDLLLQRELDNQCLNIRLTPENILFIIYTSGSTGTPKAVQIRHRNFLSFMKSLKYLQIQTSDEIAAQITQCSFDVHMEEILGTLVTGGTLVILKPGGHMNCEYLTNVIEKNQITFAVFVPTLIVILYEYFQINTHNINRLKSLRCVLTGGIKRYFMNDERNFFLGDMVEGKVVDKLRQVLNNECRIFNFYGPAESTLASACHLITEKDLCQKIVPIGRPMLDRQYYILDEHRQSVVDGEVGEIYIGGDGMFAGYLNQPENTAQVLVSIDAAPNPVYKTGDLGRMNENGEIIMLGRIDFQVKIRGITFIFSLKSYNN